MVGSERRKRADGRQRIGARQGPCEGKKAVRTPAVGPREGCYAAGPSLFTPSHSPLQTHFSQAHSSDTTWLEEGLSLGSHPSVATSHPDAIKGRPFESPALSLFSTTHLHPFLFSFPHHHLSSSSKLHKSYSQRRTRRTVAARAWPQAG